MFSARCLYSTGFFLAVEEYGSFGVLCWVFGVQFDQWHLCILAECNFVEIDDFFNDSVSSFCSFDPFFPASVLLHGFAVCLAFPDVEVEHCRGWYELSFVLCVCLYGPIDMFGVDAIVYTVCFVYFFD